ncbi:hypothetical protein [Microbacterium sp.]
MRTTNLELLPASLGSVCAGPLSAGSLTAADGRRRLRAGSRGRRL